MGQRIVEVAKNIYWIGGGSKEEGLHCNAYLIVEGEEAVLIDPGSVLDFNYVYENVLRIVQLDKIKYVILQHQDPDICAGVPLFEQKGAHFKIVTHWRAEVLIKHYGVKSEFYIINENEYKLSFKTGRTFGFILTPYLHFPGAFTTYDPGTRILFSSDLFGAFSAEWSLFAGDDYIENMKTFHEHYMPANSILRPVMEVFLGMDIKVIAPQHGSIINNNIPKYINALKNLECGTFINPIKKDLAKSGGYMSVCSTVIKRYVSFFGKDEVMDALQDLQLLFDTDMNITDYNYTGTELWNLIFEKVLTRKGIKWLMVIEPMVKVLSKEYDILIPDVFESNIRRAEEVAANLNEQNELLKEANDRLEINLRETVNSMIRCPITGLYNNEFFKDYLENEIKSIFLDESEQNPCLIIINPDNIGKIDYYYGSNEVDETLKNIVFIMNTCLEGNELLFRLHGSSFACYIPQTDRKKGIALAERIRNAIAQSEKFIQNITVSVGVVLLDEIKENLEYRDKANESFNSIASLRVKIAKSKGGNFVCSNSKKADFQEMTEEILIVGADEINIEVLKTCLENNFYKVKISYDGEEALKMIEQSPPRIIISEIMMPKIDGFLFRKELLMRSETKNIPFIYLSYLKNNDSVVRASELGVKYYLKKPYMLSELLGMINNIAKGDGAYE